MDTHTGTRKAIETPTISDDLLRRSITFGKALISIEEAMVPVCVMGRIRKGRWIEEHTYLWVYKVSNSV
jgi:hypothetical protein